MSRRSSRLQAKQQQPLSCPEEAPQELQALDYLQTRKRRTAEQEIKKREDGKIAKKHQYEIKVCEVYALHRETFYLAQDFFDRFMLTQKNINKSMLQLIGITSLFIASKLEEIYAPKIQEFAYVTDGACSVEDIVRMELIMLKALKWELCPVTIVSWLNLYLQVDALKDVPKVLLPQYSQEKFIQIAQLLDLCILDVNSLDFPYRTLAAAALCHYTSVEIVKKTSGLDWDSISECVQWMVPFVNVAKKVPVKLKNFKKVAVEERHNIQTHTNYLDMLVVDLESINLVFGPESNFSTEPFRGLQFLPLRGFQSEKTSCQLQ
ncbi:hypothetical protein DV515_00000414 [Chloebia gouldiae]|uniref:Cyclin N-terminal domain-containing protein n=1 Tax=Chloebia gouldiae TaxID=44316 RepID=A0A3L8T2I4_CHLGU|nr:hypothetical protein DV515_00000414 [Chloebia gouldiae]